MVGLARLLALFSVVLFVRGVGFVTWVLSRSPFSPYCYRVHCNLWLNLQPVLALIRFLLDDSWRFALVPSTVWFHRPLFVFLGRQFPKVEGFRFKENTGDVSLYVEEVYDLLRQRSLAVGVHLDPPR